MIYCLHYVARCHKDGKQTNTFKSSSKMNVMTRGNRVRHCDHVDEFDDGEAARELRKEPSQRAADLLVTILTTLSILFIIVTFPFTVWDCVKVVQEYERAVIFRMGRVLKAKGPGVFWVIPWLDVIQIVDLRTIPFTTSRQQVLTADLVPLSVDAVMFYRILDPGLWVTRLADGHLATHTLAETTLRTTLGTYSLADILARRKAVAQRMEDILYAAATGWGLHVERVELKDVSLPLSLQRCMALEAEAAREARAKMITADGEVKASRALKEAASGMSPVALQLRYLQTLTSSASDHSSTVVFPWPIDLLESFALQ